MLGKFGQLLRAVASGPDPARIPAPTEVIPTIELANCPTDWHWPQQTYLYAGYALEAAAAGLRSQVALSNPAGSGTMVIVEEIRIRTEEALVTMQQAVADNVSAFDSDGVEYSRDVRTYRTLTSPQPSRAPAAKVLSDQAAVAGQSCLIVLPHYYDATYYYSTNVNGFVLLPGTALVSKPNSDNISNLTTFCWRERLFDKAEVTGSAFSV